MSKQADQHAAKLKHGPAIILHILGQMVEAYAGDAVTVGRTLGIPIVKRKDGEEADLLLSMFALRHLDAFTDKLLASGFLVVVKRKGKPDEKLGTEHERWFCYSAGFFGAGSTQKQATEAHAKASGGLHVRERHYWRYVSSLPMVPIGDKREPLRGESDAWMRDGCVVSMRAEEDLRVAD